MLPGTEQPITVPTQLYMVVSRWVLPGTDGNFIRIMDIGAGVATVTLSKAVEVHAVLLLGLLLTSVPDDG
jgi:hypothetical protein